MQRRLAGAEQSDEPIYLAALHTSKEFCGLRQSVLDEQLQLERMIIQLVIYNLREEVEVATFLMPLLQDAQCLLFNPCLHIDLVFLALLDSVPKQYCDQWARQSLRGY